MAKKNGSDNSDSTASASVAKSCFFVWTLLPEHRKVNTNGTIGLTCNLCDGIDIGNILELKLHQIGTHINPYYLSASDRIIAQITSYAIRTEKTDEPWIPDWDNFKVTIIRIMFLCENEQANFIIVIIIFADNVLVCISESFLSTVFVWTIF